MTASEFRTEHGDPTTWMPADFETYEHLAEVEPIADFTLVMRQGTAPFPIPTAPTAA